MLVKLQQDLEAIYGVPTGLNITRFLVDSNKPSLQKKIRQSDWLEHEQEILFLQTKGSHLDMSLFLHPHLLAVMTEKDPVVLLQNYPLDLFCTVVEGVSHFVYSAYRAQQKIPFTQLELELQAEIDKFVLILFYLHRPPTPEESHRLRSTLFTEFQSLASQGSEASTRYQTANTFAARYCLFLEDRFILPRRFRALTFTLRQFYRYGQWNKIRAIEVPFFS